MQVKYISIASSSNLVWLTVVVFQATGITSAGVINPRSAPDLVEVGNPGNPGEIAEPFSSVLYGKGGTLGAVNYTYRIATFETTAAEYVGFLNAVAADDIYGLYKPDMSAVLGIQRSGLPGSYSYTVPADWANRPVLRTSWADAARYCNWLTNGQPIGLQGPSTTEDGSYSLYGANDQTSLYSITRSPTARFVIPNANEWYKAAFHKNNGMTDNFWDYPTSSDVVPSNLLSNPDPGNNANLFDDGYTIGGPYFRTNVGEFENSASPYGTFDQGGNVWELIEERLSTSALVQGGYFASPSSTLRSGAYGTVPSDEGGSGIGFRVVEVPEPNAFALLLFSAMVLAQCRIR